MGEMGIFNVIIFFAKRIVQSMYSSTDRKKLFRLFKDKERLSATLWCAYHSSSFDAFANRINPTIWNDAKSLRKKIRAEYGVKVEGLPISGGVSGAVGGGGVDPAKLYFLAKVTRPGIALETGVSSGVSSRAMLEAIDENGFGQLYSSDLRVLLPEGKTGFMVPDRLKDNWHLYDEGDDVNLPKIIAEVENIDFFHYDSVKSADSIKIVLDKLKALINADSIVMIDDIDRHSFFKDNDLPETRKFIFNNVGLYIGLSCYKKLVKDGVCEH